MSTTPHASEQPTPAEGALRDNTGPLRDRVRRFEVLQIRLAIEQAGGDRRLAAGRLGIGLSSLYRKLGEAASLHDGDAPLPPAPRRGAERPRPPAEA